MERILRDTKAEIHAIVTGADGAAVAADSAPAVAVVRDSDGTTIATGTASAWGSVVGGYKFPLFPSNLPEVDLLRVTWTATIGGTASNIFTTEVEVVGGHLCSLEAIKALISPAPSTDAAIAARALAEEWLEDECGVAFRPRYLREGVQSSPAGQLLLKKPRPIRLRSVSVNGVTHDAGQLAALDVADTGLVSDATWAEDSELNVVYEYGYPSPPAPVARAAARLAAYFLRERPSNLDERATSVTTEEAHYALVTPGIRGAIFALPEVNAVVQEYGYVTGVA